MSGAPDATHHNIVDDQWRAARNQKNFSLQHPPRALKRVGFVLTCPADTAVSTWSVHRAYRLTHGEADQNLELPPIESIEIRLPL